MRVLVTGMGGELGTIVTNRLEGDSRVKEILGIDIDPPRHRIRRAHFLRIDARDRRKLTRVVQDFAPTAVLHLGVYEPNARSGPTLARRLTHDYAVTALGAAARGGELDRIVVRSGIEVYGRGRGAATRPDETVLPEPTSPFGRSLLHVERVAIATANTVDVPVCSVRCAPVVGPHMASPLGRLLRLPLVPVSALADLPFSLLHLDDAATALVRALECGLHGPVNVVAAGAVTPAQASRIGRRMAVPIVGAQWRAAQVVTELLGAPLPAHVRELLVRGRTADGTRAKDVLGVAPKLSTPAVVKDLYEWASVTYVHEPMPERVAS